mmetsp:Transcript_67574/g.141239  ORF Transcript_67574/g.141239 Transcript_67574/m.141239 type:complete len:85 (-) Transcript_67574:12-266(-)
MILTASDDGTAILFDSATGKSMKTLKGHNSALSSAKFSPDQDHAVTSSVDGTAKIWNLKSGEVTQTLPVGCAVKHVACGMAILP